MNQIYTLHIALLEYLIVLTSLTSVFYLIAKYKKKSNIVKYIKYYEIHNGLSHVGNILGMLVILIGCLTQILPVDIIAVGCIGGHWYFDKLAYKTKRKNLYLIYIVTMLMLCIIFGGMLYVQ